MSTDVTFDHVAVAVERWSDAWPRFAGALGGGWRSGGQGPGFSPSQLEFANGMRLELIAPHDVEANDFLRRYLDRHGAGPHHFTFKVPDLDAALAAAAGAGFQPVGVNTADPWWKEAFLHPNGGGHGIVVQLAQAPSVSWTTPAPEGFPERATTSASLTQVAHVVASLAGALVLFRDLLGGDEVGAGADEAATWVDLAWPGPGRLRLLEPTGGAGPLTEWLGGRPGRLHHLAFAVEDPGSVPGAVALASGLHELEPDRLTGTRCLLLPG